MAVLHEELTGRDYPITNRVTLLGRDVTCDIVILAEQVSRRHALIIEFDGGHFLEDLNSVNGTFVNGGKITPRVPLRDHDRLEVGGVTFFYHKARELEPEEPERRPSFHSQPTREHQPLISFPVSEDSAAETAIVSSTNVSLAEQVEVAAQAKLRAVLELSKKLANVLDAKVVLARVLEGLFLVFPQATRGIVLLIDPGNGELVPRATRVRHHPGEGAGGVPWTAGGDHFSTSQTILKHVLTTRQGVLIQDARSDERFHPSESVQRLCLRSVLCAPLLGQEGNCLGVAQIDTEGRPGLFREEDLDVLVLACSQAARALELAHLHQERRDLEAAAHIQRSFLPRKRPQLEPLHFFDYYSAVHHVGGDYFDYIPLPNNRLAVAVGDVAGKGISAALLMARLSATARFCLGSEPSASAALRRINTLMTQNDLSDRYITLVIVVLDLGEFSLTVVNAGHPPPLHYRPGSQTVEEVGDAIIGVPLGVVDDTYEETTTPFQPGDMLVLYTDGATETRNPADEFYGVERLHQVIHRSPRNVHELGRTILLDVHTFAAGRPRNDDLTLVCIERTQSSQHAPP